MGRRRGGIPGLSFSWKRALGISQAQSRLSRGLGIPLTRAGRQRKVGGMLLGKSGCLWVVVAAALFGGLCVL